MDGLLIFCRIEKVWRNDASQEPQSTSITFAANFSRNTWGGTAWKILAAHFPHGTKGRLEGGEEEEEEEEEGKETGDGWSSYVLYSYFHKIYTGIPVGQLLLCRRALTGDKGLFSIGSRWFRSFAPKPRVFHENLYIRRRACDLHTGGSGT